MAHICLSKYSDDPYETYCFHAVRIVLCNTVIWLGEVLPNCRLMHDDVVVAVWLVHRPSRPTQGPLLRIDELQNSRSKKVSTDVRQESNVIALGISS